MENKKAIAVINEVSHFADGSFSKIDETGGYSDHVTHYRSGISGQFNQLKAKLYNAIEASGLDDRQSNALKGLIKGFCNHHYGVTIEEMDWWFTHMGFPMEKWGTPQTAEPLEDRA